MAEGHKSHGSEAVVAERGLLDVFKKEKDGDQQAAESEDINVFKFKQDDLEKEEEEEGDHHRGLKFHGSDGSSSSSDEEEGESDEKKMKKKDKIKSLKEKMKVKICGEEEKPKAEGEEVVAVKEDKKAAVHIMEVEGQPPEKKGILEKIKEKMPGGDSPASPPPTTSPLLADTVAHQPQPERHCHGGECPETETKGIVEKIKEKLPGYHSKSTE